MTPKFAVFLFWLVAASLRAESWTAVILHPPGADSSTITALSADRQVGYATIDEYTRHAVVWSGSAASFVDLNPSGSTFSYVGAIGGNRQIGYARFGTTFHAGIWSDSAASFTDLQAGNAVAATETLQAGQTNGHAAIWSGSAESLVDLNPPDAVFSTISYASGSRLGGQATFNGSFYHPGLWIVDPALPGGFAFADLFPAGVESAVLTAISGDEEVGKAVVGSQEHAALWRGTAASFVDLHPSGAQGSGATSVANGQQAGYAHIGGTTHAGIWTGTAASFVDLHPQGFTDSIVNATSGTRQVGSVAPDMWTSHAAIWSGDSASFVDLHPFLPAGYSSSAATLIWQDGETLYVAGVAVNSVTARSEAVLWKPATAQPSPAPSPSAVPDAPSLSVGGKKKLVTAKASLVIRGRARGEIVKVTYRLGKKGKWLKARGQGDWRFTAKLKPGKNLITVIAHGPAGDSAPLKLKVVRES